MMVSGWQQALTLFFAVVPGFIYQGTRSALRGPTPDDREIGVRVLRALAVSGFLVLLYIGIFGSCLTDIVTQPGFPFVNPRPTAWILIGLMFGVPIVGAVGIQYLDRKPAIRWVKELGTSKELSAYDPTPTAWDYAVDHMQEGYVRVLTKDREFVGGRLGGDSYCAGYPEPREIFLEEAWLFNDDGGFKEPIEGTSGVWIPCNEAVLVQFLRSPPHGEVATSSNTDEEMGQGR